MSEDKLETYRERAIFKNEILYRKTMAGLYLETHKQVLAFLLKNEKSTNPDDLVRLCNNAMHVAQTSTEICLIDMFNKPV